MKERISLLAVCLFWATGCITVSETTLGAQQIEYPVSLSQSLVDSSGRSYAPAQDEIIAHFKHSWRHWEMAWGTISLTDPVDFSGLLRTEIEQNRGDGIINLTAKVDFGVSYYLTSLLMIFPESIRVTVEGDIVQTRTKSE